VEDARLSLFRRGKKTDGGQDRNRGLSKENAGIRSQAQGPKGGDCLSSGRPPTSFPRTKKCFYNRVARLNKTSTRKKARVGKRKKSRVNVVGVEFSKEKTLKESKHSSLGGGAPIRPWGWWLKVAPGSLQPKWGKWSRNQTAKKN